MKTVVMVAALLAVFALQPVSAAEKRAASGKSCYTPAAIEAEQAIRFMTDVMIVSSECQDTIYAQFRLRNKDAIIEYQKAMIAHFHSKDAFDSWNTSLANEASRQQAGKPSAQICQQAAELMKQASRLDAKALHEYAAAKAAASGASYTRCGK
ncbi:MAG: hypothetical protein JO267_08885 [Alphaproteobacteria bacterium]|nr:hypothetical protein [Alphaproteobacteria bacterium]